MRVNSRLVTIADYDGSDAGEGLSVFFSQNGDSSSRYRFLVKAETSQGTFDVGEFYSSPPLATAIPGRPSRMIAGAICPGAVGWKVEVTCVASPEIADDDTADIILTSSKSFAQIGVTRVGERYAYHAGVNGNFTVLAGMKVTGIAAISTGAGSIVIAGGDPITVPNGISANLAPEASIPPNSVITFTNVDWVIEYLESS